MPSLAVFELFGRLLACLLTCVLACLPACLLAYLHACLLACLPHFTSIGVAASGGVASLLRSIPSQPPWLLVAWPLCMCGLRCGPVVFAGSMAWRRPVTRSPHPSLHFDASLWLKQYALPHLMGIVVAGTSAVKTGMRQMSGGLGAATPKSPF